MQQNRFLDLLLQLNGHLIVYGAVKIFLSLFLGFYVLARGLPLLGVDELGVLEWEWLKFILFLIVHVRVN